MNRIKRRRKRTRNFSIPLGGGPRRFAFRSKRFIFPGRETETVFIRLRLGGRTCTHGTCPVQTYRVRLLGTRTRRRTRRYLCPAGAERKTKKDRRKRPPRPQGFRRLSLSFLEFTFIFPFSLERVLRMGFNVKIVNSRFPHGNIERVTNTTHNRCLY